MNTNITSNALSQLDDSTTDVLTALLRNGARQLSTQAVEAELAVLLEEHSSRRLPDGCKALVRNGYLPERSVQTGIGDVTGKVPKVRDRSGNGIKFNSRILPPYLKRARSVAELLPWLYLKGVSTGEYQEALSAVLGDNAKGLLSNTISRLKTKWQEEHRAWQLRDLSAKRYVYFWADGIYSNVRMDDRLCLLVIMGVTSDGRNELIAVEEGYRESEASWLELLNGLVARGLTTGPKLATADGALGFWKALSKAYPQTRQQRCWVHKTANVLNKLPKAVQPKVKASLHDIWMADTRDNAHKAFDVALAKYSAKYPKAMECLKKDRDAILAFYDFPAEHWTSIRTTNPIESAFATVRLRTAKMRNCGSRDTTLAMVFKLLETAQKRWNRLHGFTLLALVINNVKFQDGIQVEGASARDAA